MVFSNEEEAKQCLAHISYFRLKYYWTDMRDEETEHDFKEGALFDDVIARYNFDRNLRLILFDAIEIIEVALRAKIRVRGDRSLDTQTNLPESHNETTSFLQSAFLNFDVQCSGRSEKGIQHELQVFF